LIADDRSSRKPYFSQASSLRISVDCAMCEQDFGRDWKGTQQRAGGRVLAFGDLFDREAFNDGAPVQHCHPAAQPDD
jgi:hypothetical protein